VIGKTLIRLKWQDRKLQSSEICLLPSGLSSGSGGDKGLNFTNSVISLQYIKKYSVKINSKPHFWREGEKQACFVD